MSNSIHFNQFSSIQFNSIQSIQFSFSQIRSNIVHSDIDQIQLTLGFCIFVICTIQFNSKWIYLFSTTTPAHKVNKVAVLRNQTTTTMGTKQFAVEEL